jgi:hypothetical protein
MGGDACAARLRVGLFVPHAVDVGGGRSRDALGLLHRDGPVDGLDLLGLHRYQHRATFFIAAAMFGATGLYGYTQPSAIYRSSALS